jgi:hypothetical protein
MARMQIFLFQSEKYLEVVGITPQEGGENLPKEFVPWIPLGGSEIGPAIDIPGIGRSEVMFAKIQRDGFCLALPGGPAVAPTSK